MKRCRSIAPVVAALSLAACGKAAAPPRGVYDIGLNEAYQRLYAADLAPLVYSRQCGILIHLTSEGIVGREVTWKVRSSGQDVAEFTAVLTPISTTQTKVDIRMPADPAGGEIYDGGKFYPRPAFNQPLRPAVEEQVAAILEGRPYDVSRIGAPTDSVCNAQRGGLETGMRFRVDDLPGKDAEQSLACRRDGRC